MLRKMKSYNQGDIREWSQDLDNLPDEIANKSKDIADDQRKLITIAADLQAHLVGKVNPTQADIDALQARLYVIELPPVIEQLQKDHTACEAKLKELRPLHASQIALIKPINERINKLAMAIKILDYQDEIVHHQDDINNSLRNIADLDAGMARQRAELQAKTEQRATAETTLTGLHLRLLRLRTELAAVITRDESNSQYSSSNSSQASGYSSSVQRGSQYSSSAGGDGRGAYLPVSAEQQHLREEIAALEGEIRNVERISKDLRRQERKCDEEFNGLSGARDAQLQRKASLLHEIKDDEQAIDNCYRSIGTQNWAMNRPNLQQLIRDEESEREPYVREQARLKAEIDAQLAEGSRLQSSWSSNNALLQRSSRLQGKYTGNNNVSDLDGMIDKQKLVLAGFERVEMQKRKLVEDEEAVIKSKQEQRTILENKFTGQLAKKFLFDLRDHPRDLLEFMLEKIKHNIREYEKTHQSGQSIAVRACLAKLQDKADFIVTNNNIVGNTADDVARHKYYQLSGLIHHEMARLDDVALQASLQAAFAAEMVDANEALGAYQELQNVYLAVLHDLTADDVKNEDLRLYVAARDDFQQTLDLLPADATKQWKNLKYYCSRSLKDTEKHRLAAAKVGDDSFDHKFQTNLIHALSAVYATPKDQNARDALHDLSAHIPYGNSSLAKKLGGIILMVLGAAAAIAGLAVGFFSLGMLSPVSIGCMAGGATLFAIGSGLLINGRQKDEAKSVANVEKAASHPKLTSSLFPRADMLAVPGEAGHPDASAPRADLLDMNLN